MSFPLCKQSVGFIGLGAMGLPMAENLAIKLPQSSQMFVFDVVAKGMNGLCSRHPERVVACSSAKELAERSDIVLTMLPEGHHVKSAYADPNSGVFSADVSGKVLVDCSTIDIATSLWLKTYTTEHFPTAHFYDAPVSGGTIGAEKATLAFYVGCSKDDPNLLLLTSLLQLMGDKILPLGASSLGLVAKLANNYCAAVIGIACIEAYDMAIRSGLDPRLLERVLAEGSGQNAVSEKWNPVPGIISTAPSSNDYKPGFRVELMRKDVGLALDMAGRAGCNNILGSTVLETYNKVSEDSAFRGLDSKIIYRYLGGKEDWKKDFDGAS